MADIGRSVPHHGSGGLIVPPVSYPITLTEDQHNDMLAEIASAGLAEVEKRDKRIAELEASRDGYKRRLEAAEELIATLERELEATEKQISS